MYGYFDESIIVVKGIKYLFLGFIVLQNKPTENIILKEFLRTKSPIKNKKEIKYTNVRDSKIKEEVLKKIKSVCVYYSTSYIEIDKTETIHKQLTKLVEVMLAEYFGSNNKKLDVIYDKVSYQIDLKHLTKVFKEIKTFKFRNSEHEVGIQYADWIVGEASENFKHKKPQQKNRQ